MKTKILKEADDLEIDITYEDKHDASPGFQVALQHITAEAYAGRLVLGQVYLIEDINDELRVVEAWADAVRLTNKMGREFYLRPERPIPLPKFFLNGGLLYPVARAQPVKTMKSSRKQKRAAEAQKGKGKKHVERSRPS